MNQYSLVLCLLSILISFVAETVARNQRILDGTLAEVNQFPYQVAVQIFGKTVCSGVIIDKQYVVAAAHCVYTPKDRFVAVPIKIVAGVNNLATSENRVMVNVAEVFVPKEFDPHARPYYSTPGDISVLKLHRELDFEENLYIAKVELPKGDETYEDVEAIVSGFGYNVMELYRDPKTGEVEEEGSSDGKLRFSKAKVLSNTDCRAMYNGPIFTEHICAQVTQRDPKIPAGVCDLDSGGPLVYNNTLIGVVNASPGGCRERKKPGIYARVSKYVNFIEKIMNGKLDDTVRSDDLPVFG